MKHIPFTGRNPVFQESLDVKPHLLILNKMDLTDLSNEQVRSLAVVLAESHQRFKTPTTHTKNLCFYPAEDPGEAGKTRGEERSLHRLFKAERRQHQKGNCVLNIRLFAEV